jgi:hypothetical protein
LYYIVTIPTYPGGTVPPPAFIGWALPNGGFLPLGDPLLLDHFVSDSITLRAKYENVYTVDFLNSDETSLTPSLMLLDADFMFGPIELDSYPGVPLAEHPLLDSAKLLGWRIAGTNDVLPNGFWLVIDDFHGLDIITLIAVYETVYTITMYSEGAVYDVPVYVTADMLMPAYALGTPVHSLGISFEYWELGGVRLMNDEITLWDFGGLIAVNVVAVWEDIYEIYFIDNLGNELTALYEYFTADQLALLYIDLVTAKDITAWYPTQVFDGWYLDGSKVTFIIPEAFENGRRSITLIAQIITPFPEYMINKYSDGVLIDSFRGIRYTDLPFALGIPPGATADKIFLGWELNGRLVTSVTLADFGRINIISVYAAWDDNSVPVIIYTVVFVDAEGRYIDTIERPETGFPYTPSGYVDPEGIRTFKTWTLNGMPITMLDVSDFDDSRIITLIAQWREPYREYMINMYNENGELITSVKIEANRLPYALDPIYEEGREFIGWFKDPYNDDIGISAINVGDFRGFPIISVWAKFADSRYHEPWSIVYFDHGLPEDNIIDSVTIRTTAQVRRPDDPVREGYRFAGWFERGTLNVWNFNNYVRDDILYLVAAWESLDGDGGEIDYSVKFTVIFDANGQYFVDAEYEEYEDDDGNIRYWVVLKDGVFKNDKIKLENAPAVLREGYNFLGWYYEDSNGFIFKWNFDSNVVKDDIVLFAVWEEIQEIDRIVPWVIWPIFAGIGLVGTGELIWMFAGESLAKAKKRKLIKYM